MNPRLVARCRDKLIEISRRRSTITYGELATHLGVANLSIGKYLNAVYNDLVVNQGLPEVTLLAVRKGTQYGWYHSRGGAAQSVEFDPADPRQRALYDSDRERVYGHWA